MVLAAYNLCGIFRAKDQVSMADKKCILVVDDEESICKLFGIVLNSRYEFFAAGTVEQAVDLLEENRIDLIIADQRLPRASGLELCRIVQETFPRTVVIMMSGSPDPEIEGLAKEAGAVEYLHKPFEMMHALQLIERTLD